METRLINWRTAMMKPVVPGTYMIVGTHPAGVKNNEIALTLFIITRVTEDGWVYGIESIDEKEAA
jgi:hypothetical protein